MGKEDNVIHLVAESSESTNYTRIEIKKVEEACSECGHPEVRKPFGQIFIPKSLGVKAEKIIITVKRKEAG